MKLVLPIDLVLDNTFGGFVFRSMPFLIYKPTAIHQKPIMMSLWFFILLKVCDDKIKSSKHHPL